MTDLTPTQVLKMEAGPELNALIATEVMGWIKDGDELQGWEWCDLAEGNEFVMHCNWSPSTDIVADYEVLVFVRENWDEDEIETWHDALSDIYAKRENYWAASYQPGDYSRAALFTTL